MIILSPQQLDQAVDHLSQGQTVVFPTETSYGLGCDATNQAAVDKVFQIKGRSPDKPLLVVVPDIVTVKKYVVWDSLIEKLMDYPEPLTIVARLNKEANGGSLAKGVAAAEGTLAIRLTDHPVLNTLASALDKPLVATSANPSGTPDIYNFQEVKEVFSQRQLQPDVLLDFGMLPEHPPSTIVSVVDGEIKLLRGKWRKDLGSAYA